MALERLPGHAGSLISKRGHVFDGRYAGWHDTGQNIAQRSGSRGVDLFQEPVNGRGLFVFLLPGKGNNFIELGT